MAERVVIREPAITVRVGLPGLQGPPGPPGVSLPPTLTLGAAAAVGARRAVWLAADGLRHADALVPDSAHALLGLSLHAAAAGAACTVLRLGELSDPAWSFSRGPVWLGSDGNVTQSPPTAGVAVQVGFALASDRLLVDPGPPISLS